jgi:hypothetical protein
MFVCQRVAKGNIYLYVFKKNLHFKIACKLWHLIMWWSIWFCGFWFSIRFDSMMENFFRSLMPYTYLLLSLPQPPTTSLGPFEHYASSIKTIFMNFFHRCFINFSKLKHKCENVSRLITCSITPINHHGIFSIVKHFSRSDILIMLLALQQFLPGLFFHGNIFLTLCFFNIQEETRTIYMDKFFHVFTLHSSSLLCSDNMLSPELSPVLCTAIRLQATNKAATLEPLLQTTTK